MQQIAFKPTLTQKLLSKHYKWIYFIKFYRNSQLTYNANSLFHSLSSIVSFLVLVGTWYIGSYGNPNLDFKGIFTYLVVGYMYSAFTPMWISEMLGYKIYGGALTSYLIKPTSVFWLGFMEMIGRGVVVASILVLLPYLILMPFISQFMFISTNWMSYIGLVLLIPITLLIKYCIDFVVGCCSFWIINNGGLIRLYSTIVGTLNGSMIPLNLIIRFIPFVVFLPTALEIYYPVQIYLNPSLQNIGFIYGLGTIWCVVSYIVAATVFKLGLKRNEAVGL
jgi:ABC-2 type transport system permease protein